MQRMMLSLGPQVNSVLRLFQSSWDRIIQDKKVVSIPAIVTGRRGNPVVPSPLQSIFVWSLGTRPVVFTYLFSDPAILMMGGFRASGLCGWDGKRREPDGNKGSGGFEEAFRR